MSRPGTVTDGTSLAHSLGDRGGMERALMEIKQAIAELPHPGTGGPRSAATPMVRDEPLLLFDVTAMMAAAAALAGNRH